MGVAKIPLWLYMDTTGAHVRDAVGAPSLAINVGRFKFKRVFFEHTYLNE